MWYYVFPVAEIQLKSRILFNCQLKYPNEISKNVTVHSATLPLSLIETSLQASKLCITQVRNYDSPTKSATHRGKVERVASRRAAKKHFHKCRRWEREVQALYTCSPLKSDSILSKGQYIYLAMHACQFLALILRKSCEEKNNKFQWGR